MTSKNLIIKSPYDDLLQEGSQRDLSRFLYYGAGKYKSNIALKLISQGKLGLPIPERMELLITIKEEMTTRLVSGHSYHSLPSYLVNISQFLRFLEKQKLPFDLDSLEENFLLWADHLYLSSKGKSKTLKPGSAYTKAMALSSIFSSILNSKLSLMKKTRLKKPVNINRSISKNSEKQNLEKSFRQGTFLVDIVTGLSVEAIYGALPLKIPVRDEFNDKGFIKLYAGLTDLGMKTEGKEKLCYKEKVKYSRRAKKRAQTNVISGKNAAKRWQLVNLRIQAEFLIFLAQTGMNLAQAKELKRGSLKYRLTGDNWEVRSYKNRKGGEVTFNIHKSYKPFMERHRSFISHFFPKSEYFFPLFKNHGKGESIVRSGLESLYILHTTCVEYDIPWTAPSNLRNTRINWILRRSGDLDLTAEMAQHTVKVLKNNYEKPSQQRAMTEITQFWNEHDPISKSDLEASIIASSCNGRPESVDYKPESVVEPNCISPSGCLWCRHHRDSDTEDYVWSLVSMWHVKKIEAAMNLTRQEVPADLSIERLANKIAWFRNSTPIRAQWVREAKCKIEEGEFHPNWSSIIDFLE